MFKLMLNPMRWRLLLATVVAALVAAIACIPAVAREASCERPSSLRVAFIPLGETQDTDVGLDPLFEELQKALGMHVEASYAPSYGAVMEGLLAGAIDLARLGPASYVAAHKSDARIIPFASLYRMPDMFTAVDSSSYYSLLIIRRHDAIRSIADLKGKRLALVDPDSTSGALIPLHVFSRELGTSLNQYFSRVGYSGNHEQSVVALMDGEVDAAFVASSNLARLITLGRLKRSDIRVLWQSKPIPFDPFVYRAQLCEDIKRKIRDVFFDKDSANIKTVLSQMGALRFVVVHDQDYKIIRELP